MALPGVTKLPTLAVPAIFALSATLNIPVLTKLPLCTLPAILSKLVPALYVTADIAEVFPPLLNNNSVSLPGACKSGVGAPGAVVMAPS